MNVHIIGCEEELDICFQVKVQWTEQLVATQQQKTEQIKKETEQLKVTTSPSLSSYSPIQRDRTIEGNIHLFI